MKRYGRSGWFKDSHRHYLAAKGVKTKRFDIKNIEGRWQQKSVTPVPFFQKNCVKVQADYAARNKNSIAITNYCKNKKGKVRKIEGIGRKTNDPNKLKVDFAPYIPIPGSAANYEVEEFSGDSMTVRGGKYRWELERVKDKEAFLK